MKGAQAGNAGKLSEIRLLGMMAIEKPDDICYSFVIVHADSLTRAKERARPVLATILENFFGQAIHLTGADHLLKLAYERFARFGVVVITPDHDFEHLGPDIATALQSGADSAARRPILRFRSRDIFIRRSRVPITIKNVKRNSAIVEAIETHRKIHTVDRHHTDTVIVFHGASTRGEANVGTVNLQKARGGAAR